MKNSKKGINRIVLVILFLLAGSVFLKSYTHSTVTKAYTEEQKQAAKAWLSAHGYPPTKEGAYQAYQDYQNGKLKLSEEEQKGINKSLGKSSKKDKNSSQKKKSSKKKRKKTKSTKKSVDTEKKITATPQTQSPDGESGQTQIKQTASPAAPSVHDVTTEDKEQKRGTDEEESAGWGRVYFIIALCVIAVGSSEFCIWKKKSSK